MPRYIDADALINELQFYQNLPTKQAMGLIKVMPTVDVAEVKHGKWVHSKSRYQDESDYKCSNCGYQAKMMVVGGHLVGGYGAEAIGAEWVEEKEPNLSPYCPSCGYSMTKEGDEDGND